MQFDWTTFFLELLNFLILLWLLKRFLYKPVLSMLDARKHDIQVQAAQAVATQRAADALKGQYETRLQAWQQEQEKMRHALEEELAQERLSRVEALKKSLAEQSAKEQARAKVLNAEREAQLVRQASREAYAAAAAILKRLSGPELTTRITEVVVEDLAAQTEEQRAVLRQAAAALGQEAKVEIATAHKLCDAALRGLVGAVQEAVGQPLRTECIERPELIAGVRIALGECLLQANLAEELAFFREDGQSGKNT